MNLLNAYLRSSRAQQFLNRKPSEAGFSLIELVVVVAVLAVISAIAIPAFTDVSRKAATSAAKQSLAAFYGQCAVERADNAGGWTATTKAISIRGYTPATVACNTASWSYASLNTNNNPTLGLTLATGDKTCTAGGAPATLDCPW